MRVALYLGRGAHFRSCILSAAHVVSSGSLDGSPPDKIYLVKDARRFWRSEFHHRHQRFRWRSRIERIDENL